MAPRCAVHGATASVATCSACGAPMCDACYRFVVANSPACVRCAHEQATRARRRISLGVFTALTSVAAAALIARRLDGGSAVIVAVATAVTGAAVGILLALAGWKRARAGVSVDRRTHPGAAPATGVTRARAARARHALAALSPSLSARATALALLAAMLFSAVSFPLILRLPRWLELEAVLAAWWLSGVITLYLLLVRGYRLQDDHFFHAPRMPSVRDVDGIGDFPTPDADCGSSCDDLLGLLFVGVLAVLLVACSLLAAWLFVELVLPLVFLAAYSAILLALRRAARDRHHCQGDALASLRWALLWSSLYFAPLAALVWALHRVLPGAPG